MFSSVLAILACGLDWQLGEPKRFHPLVIFGSYATFCERLCRSRLITIAVRNEYAMGVISWCITILPWVFLLVALLESVPTYLYWVISLIVLTVCIAHRSLYDHVLPILIALQKNNIELARGHLSKIVSRNTQSLSEADIRRASIESTLENCLDGITATLFWFAVAGAPGALLHRLSNTLDAMWGYKNTRYRAFGFCAAKIDDLIAYIPARITALSFIMLGDVRKAIDSWRKNAKHLSSPNGGPVMTAGAGALRVSLGGPAEYEGVIVTKPFYGDHSETNNMPSNEDIANALRLVRRTIILWLGAFLIWDLFHVL